MEEYFDVVASGVGYNDGVLSLHEVLGQLFLLAHDGAGLDGDEEEVSLNEVVVHTSGKDSNDVVHHLPLEILIARVRVQDAGVGVVPDLGLIFKHEVDPRDVEQRIDDNCVNKRVVIETMHHHQVQNNFVLLRLFVRVNHELRQLVSVRQVNL